MEVLQDRINKVSDGDFFLNLYLDQLRFVPGLAV